MPALTRAPHVGAKAAARSQDDRAPGDSRTARADSQRLLQVLGWAGLAAIVASALAIAAGAAHAPSQYVPARSGGWPDWLAGPLHVLGISIGRASFEAYTLVLCAGYAAVLASARTLPARALAGAILVSQAVLFLGPPLISQDVFGYLGFARMGGLHGLDPYTHIPAEAPADAAFPFIGWPFKHSPYGPLFTLGSYALAPLSLAAGLWTLKALALLSSLAATALVARAAGRVGGSRRWAAAFVGLNPVLLELALGGAHNDTLVLLALSAALALSAGAHPRFRAAACALVAGLGVKVTAGLALPFLLLAPAGTRERLRVGVAAAGALAALAALALIGFGGHALGFLGAVGEQQQLVATHSIPAETARLFGLSGTPSWWRHLFGAAFAIAAALALWRTARGSDWRVMLGWTTLALLVCTAWLLPWYAIWALPLAAVGGDRRLRAATLVLCAYAILIHLPLADPLLSPKRAAVHRTAASVGVRAPARDGLEFARFQIPGDVARDLGG